MPKQIQTTEEFEKLLTKALQLRVVRLDEFVKLKLRTPDFLYTYKTTSDEANDLIKSAKDIEVMEFNPERAKKESEQKEAEELAKKKKESEKAVSESKGKRKKKTIE